MMYSRLQYISQGNDLQSQLDHIYQALDAGCQWIQLRFKNSTEADLMKAAIETKKRCQAYRATCIINDHVHVAAACEADGVHVGLGDMPVSEARAILGPDRIIGGTANTLEDVWKRVEEACNYIGLGPFRFTATKEKLSPILGTEGYLRILTEMKKRSVEIPVYAIGGIGPKDVDAILATGVYGIAVSGIITQHLQKKQLVEHLNNVLYASTQHSR